MLIALYCDLETNIEIYLLMYLLLVNKLTDMYCSPLRFRHCLEAYLLYSVNRYNTVSYFEFYLMYLSAYNCFVTLKLITFNYLDPD